MGSYGYPKIIQKLNLSLRMSGLLLTLFRMLNTFWFPTLATVFFSRNCGNGWKTFWSACKSDEFPLCEDYETSDIHICYLYQEDLCGIGFRSPINHCMRDIFRLFAK